MARSVVTGDDKALAGSRHGVPAHLLAELAVLAAEFTWARRLLDSAKTRAGRVHGE